MSAATTKEHSEARRFRLTKVFDYERVLEVNCIFGKDSETSLHGVGVRSVCQSVEGILSLWFWCAVNWSSPSAEEATAGSEVHVINGWSLRRSIKISIRSAR